MKEVEAIASPSAREWTNKQYLKPRALFTENHKHLVAEGEKWMKDTASSSTVVGALIITVTFAAAFTFPGGNDQNHGFPIFLREKLFKVFMMSNAVALFTSITSVLMFLGILTSRYGEDDFLKSLPKKLILGLSTLFLSMAAMIIAFCAGLALMFHRKLWIVIPSISLASISVVLFVLMQFPLLVDIFFSTYGPSIFDRNVKRWI